MGKESKGSEAVLPEEPASARPASQVYRPRPVSLPKHIAGGDFRDELLKMLHCLTEKTGFIHFICSIGEILKHQFKATTENEGGKKFDETEEFFITIKYLYSYFLVASYKSIKSQKNYTIKKLLAKIWKGNHSYSKLIKNMVSNW